METLCLRKCISRFQIFLAIKTCSFDESISTLCGAGNKYEIDWKEFLVLYFDDVTNYDLTPLYSHEGSIS